MWKQIHFTFFLCLLIFIINCTQSQQSVIVSHVLLSKSARPLTNISFASSPERVKRGAYLVNGVLRCFTCHSPLDSMKPGWPPIKGKEGAGGVFRETDSFHVIAPNITPDSETGAGKWTDDMFARAIREGVGHDGRALSAGMPYYVYENLSDEDLASVIVYLKTIPAVKNKLPERYLSETTEKRLQMEPRPPIGFVTQPDLSTIIKRGQYLVTMGECEGCHTGWYERNPGVFGGGNIIQRSLKNSVCSPNLTPDPTGLGGWDDSTFIRVIRTGKSGMLNMAMPWVAYRNMTDEDLSAVLAALNTLAPVQHRVVNSMPPTFCEVCGQKHGYGEYNKIVPVKKYPANTLLYPSYAGTYVNKYGDTTIISLKQKKLWVNTNQGDAELIPVSPTRFQASGFLAPISFIKDKSGKVNTLLLYDIIIDTSMRKQ